MKKESRRKFRAAAGLLAAFALWTAAVSVVDVQAVGPLESEVGFASLNQFVHALTEVNMVLYSLTDWLGLVPVAFAAGFAVLGLAQWIRRRKLCGVDRNIIALGGFYIAVAAVYVFFEQFVVNYRPVLIEGVLEASYPSSTTVLVMCVMPTAALQLRERMKNGPARRAAVFAMNAFTAFMVLGRLLSGVHWMSDIIGGALLSAGLVMLYRAVSNTEAG